MIKALPNIITRISPEAFHTLDKLKMNNTIHLLDELKMKSNSFESLTNKICDQLYNLIQSDIDDQSRKLLLNLKRNIYNNRNITSDYQKITDEKTANAIHRWLDSTRELNRLEKKIREVFDEEIIEKRTLLQDMANINSLKRTTSLSSRSLHKKWDKYLNTPITKQNKKTRKIERSILLYLSRMVTKTSPFSSLTLIGHGKISSQVSDWKLDDITWDSEISINHVVSIYLWELISNSKLVPFLPLESNSSMKILDTTPKKMEFIKVKQQRVTHKFLTQSEQRVVIPFNEQIYSLYKYIQSNKGVSIIDLVDSLSNSNNKEKTVQFLERLIDIKVINFETPYCEQDPNYLEKIHELLQNIGNDTLKSNTFYRDLCFSIEQLQFLSQSSSISLETKLKSVEDQFKEIVSLFEDVDNHFPNIEPIIYEDCFIKQELAVPEISIDDFIQDIKALQELYILFDPHLPVKIYLNEIFHQNHKDNGTVSILEFQKTIQSLLEKSENETLPFIIEEISGNDLYEEWLTLRKKFFSEIFSCLKKDKEEVIIDKEFLNQLSEEIPKELSSMCPKSWSYFLQPLADSGFVINKISDGNGKFMSRFMQGILKHTGTDISQNTKSYLQKSNSKNNHMVELNGVFGFNANVHPKITDYEIKYPGVKSKKSSENMVELDDIYVRSHQSGNGIELYSKSTNKTIDLLYLQFLNLKLLPPLFRFLIYFSELCNPDISINEAYFHLGSSPDKKIVHFPRIKIGKTVIKRRQWWIDKEYFLKGNSYEHDHYERFKNLRQWLQSKSIPSQFYLKANPSLQMLNQGEVTHYQDGMRKPQYIDIDSFHFCQIFFNQIQVMNQGFIIEEALPNEKQVPLNIKNNRHMMELLIETYEMEA